jgi:hypothetical protein
MESSDLFSHPYEPQVVSKRESSDEPTEPPVFSDRPQTDSSTAEPSS